NTIHGGDMNTRFLLAVAATFAALTVVAQAPGIKRTVLQKTDIGPKREVVMARAEIAAGASAGRHSHPGGEVGYVLEGSSEVLIDGEAPKIVKAGESYVIPEGKIHDARPVGNKSVTVLATYIVDKDKPLATPAPK